MTDLTPRQLDILRLIQDDVAIGKHPNLPEIAAFFGWPYPGDVQHLVADLIKKGYVSRDARRAWSVRKPIK